MTNGWIDIRNTDMMLIMTVASMIAIPAFFIAARRFSADREALRVREAGA